MGIGITGYAIIALGAILAAVIAGAFSFLNLITSKEQKVSEFRQNWIDTLRNSISEYISSLSYISILYKRYNEKDDDNKDHFEMTKGIEDIYAKVNKSYNDIIFRVNDKETDEKGKQLNNAFLCALEATRNHYNKTNYFEAFKSCYTVREATKPLLKYEWDRVKNGEPAYKKAKRISIVVLIVGLMIAVLDFSYVIYQSDSSVISSKIQHQATQDRKTISRKLPATKQKETPNQSIERDVRYAPAPHAGR